LLLAVPWRFFNGQLCQRVCWQCRLKHLLPMGYILSSR
jgi:hypothetical protein